MFFRIRIRRARLSVGPDFGGAGQTGERSSDRLSQKFLRKKQKINQIWSRLSQKFLRKKQKINQIWCRFAQKFLRKKQNININPIWSHYSQKWEETRNKPNLKFVFLETEAKIKWNFNGEKQEINQIWNGFLKTFYGRSK